MLPAVRAAIHTLQVAVPPSFARPFYSLTAANPGALAMLPCVLNLSCLEFFFSFWFSGASCCYACGLSERSRC
jgi:hypothetical protein